MNVLFLLDLLPCRLCSLNGERVKAVGHSGASAWHHRWTKQQGVVSSKRSPQINETTRQIKIPVILSAVQIEARGLRFLAVLCCERNELLWKITSFGQRREPPPLDGRWVFTFVFLKHHAWNVCELNKNKRTGSLPPTVCLRHTTNNRKLWLFLEVNAAPAVEQMEPWKLEERQSLS